MIRIWVDAQLPPGIADWISERFDVEARAVRTLFLKDSSDLALFGAALARDAIILTKGRDFWELSKQRSPVPRIIWLRFGNTTNRRLKEILALSLSAALARLDAGERIVQIFDPDDTSSR
jgi:predicted nuclease of predicted toxin-antitoxin system